MEQQASTSKVTVEYFDPHNVYELLKPGLIPRLPLHKLHWQSHSGPLRSIDTLHIELVEGGKAQSEHESASSKPAAPSETKDDGSPTTQDVAGQPQDAQGAGAKSAPVKFTVGRRHQIPGLRRTPYLKMLLVRCDDNESYKNSVRSQVREWIKRHAPPINSSKKTSNQENHDAYEWLILHVVIPNTAASTQPRSSSGKSDSSTEKVGASRWRTGSTPLMEKFRSDFNSSGKGSPDRIAQIRIGINDVPYDMLPRVVPAVPTGYTETEQDAERAWNDLMSKLKNQILSSFDQRVSQYEEDIKEKHTQRILPGWNFCTFFILKEGLALGFENVGLVEDALVGYDELNAGLDLVLAEQAQTGEPESHGGAILPYTEDLKQMVQKALQEVTSSSNKDDAANLQVTSKTSVDADHIPISAAKKPYRDMILANKVSVFDFRCYIFARQIALLLRQANTSVTREQLLSRLKEQQESVLHGVAPMAKATPLKEDDTENLAILAEICRRALEFVPSLSNVMRHDIILSLQSSSPKDGGKDLSPEDCQVIDNLVSSFTFSIAQQILAQTATKALPIASSPLPVVDGVEQKDSIPEPKTMQHPARNSSLNAGVPGKPPSPDFPGPGRVPSQSKGDAENVSFSKIGVEELAAGRAELYMMSRSILQRLGKMRGWSTGWDKVPAIFDPEVETMEEISLDDDTKDDSNSKPTKGDAGESSDVSPNKAGIRSQLLITATSNEQDFYRLYEILTDRALRHYTVADQRSTVQCAIADLAVLKFFMKEYTTAKSYFEKALQFFSKLGWSTIELSLLIMYLQCLSERSSDAEYVRAALQLLTVYCAVKRSRSQDSSAHQLRLKREPEGSPIEGVIAKLCEVASSFSYDVRSPLSLYMTNIDLIGTPSYEDGCDGCYVTIGLESLLPDDIPLEKIQFKVCGVDEGSTRELIFENKANAVLKPGSNKLLVYTNSVIPGKYKVSHLTLRSARIVLFYDVDDSVAQPSADTPFRHAEINLYQRSNALDVVLKATKHTSLDKNNSLELSLSTGWNTLKRCEIRIRPSTGGLRLLTTEATVLDSSVELARPPESGLFRFDAVAARTTVTLRFPFSLELDLDDILVKVEVAYVSGADESYRLAKTLGVPVSLAVGVNVQDLFKHGSLFSRFIVTTTSSSPLRLHKSELPDSELFSATTGAVPAGPVTIFPKQSASILYRIRRRAAAAATTPAAGTISRAARTLYLRLHYTQLDAEVAELVRQSVVEALEAASLGAYARAVLAALASDLRQGLRPHDLERAALLGKVSTSFLRGIAWDKRLHGLAADPVVRSLAGCLHRWQSEHPHLVVSSATTTSTSTDPAETIVEPCSVLIPVEVPSLTIVHTADIRLRKSLLPASINAAAAAAAAAAATPAVFINQVLHATLRLRWTRTWDVTTSRAQDLEFSYDVSAAADTWLVGGRRRGHFVIPACSAPDSGGGGGGGPDPVANHESSTPETEAEIPLVLVPLKLGWLPYPSVDIREVRRVSGHHQQQQQQQGTLAAASGTGGGGGSGSDPSSSSSSHAVAGHNSMEVDYRNLGETIRVVSDKQAITVSLDASGPSGGPLVFETESRPRVQGTRIVA